MKCILKQCGLFLISYSDNLTLVGVKRHQPLTFPGFKLGIVQQEFGGFSIDLVIGYKVFFLMVSCSIGIVFQESG